MRRLHKLFWMLLALLVLAGCGNSASTPRYAATGSWQGSATGAAGGEQAAEALVASDGSLQLALLGSGEQCFGAVRVYDNNYGQGNVTVVKPQTRQSVSGVFKFVLEAGLLTGYVQAGGERWDVQLQPTAAAVGPARPEELAGTWSLLPDRLQSYVRVDPALKVSGSLGCTWGGQWSVPDPAWNLYRVTLTAVKCFDPAMNGTYQGLATLAAPAAGNSLHLLLAAPNDGRTLAFDWYATVNQAPTAHAGADVRRTVLPGASGMPVVLDGLGSRDPNGDPLTYRWTVVSGDAVLIDADSATPSFVPPGAGEYVFHLTVNDGVYDSPEESGKPTVVVTVAYTPDRFKLNGDGTVTDNTTGLVWLQDANCFTVPDALWNADEARLELAPALASGQCGLSDGSVAGDWRLPSQAELRSLLDTSYLDPALSNADGYLQWSPGDPFVDVVSNRYWTATGDSGSTYDPVNDWYESYYYVDLYDGRSGVNAWGSGNYVWPVRDPRPAAAAAGR